MDLIPPTWFWPTVAVLTGGVVGVVKLLQSLAETRKTTAVVAHQLTDVCEDCGERNGNCNCPPDGRPATARMRLDEVAHGMDRHAALLQKLRDEVRDGLNRTGRSTDRVDERLLGLEVEVREVKDSQSDILRRVEEHAGQIAEVRLDQNALRTQIEQRNGSPPQPGRPLGRKAAT